MKGLGIMNNWVKAGACWVMWMTLPLAKGRNLVLEGLVPGGEDVGKGCLGTWRSNSRDG